MGHAGDGYWYKDTINGQTYGLTTTWDGGYNYVTASGPYSGGAATGAIVVIKGQKTNLVLNSWGDYWCNSGSGWSRCDENFGKYDSSFVRTDIYRTASLLSPRSLRPFPSLPPRASLLRSAAVRAKRHRQVRRRGRSPFHLQAQTTPSPSSRSQRATCADHTTKMSCGCIATVSSSKHWAARMSVSALSASFSCLQVFAVMPSGTASACHISLARSLLSLLF